MAYSIKHIHASHHQQAYLGQGNAYVDKPQRASHDADLRKELVVRYPRGFAQVKPLPAASLRWQKGERKEDDAETTHPLREATPEQYAMRQTIGVRQNGEARSGKPRHDFKEGIGYARHVVPNKQRTHSNKRKENPSASYNEVGITPRGQTTPPSAVSQKN